MSEVEQVLHLWALHMTAQNCTERTIRERLIVLRSFARFNRLERLEDATKVHLLAFLSRPDILGSSRRTYRSTLSTFYGWCEDEELITRSPALRLPKVRTEPHEPNPVTTNEIQALIDSGIYGHTITKVLLYAYEGLRASEIAAIRGENVDWAHARIFVEDAKGRREVWRPMHSLVWDHVLEHGYPREGHWFPHGDGHVTGRSVSDVISKAMKRAGIHHRPHELRKWHGTTLLAVGADSLDVQHSLRHADGQSMKAYVLPNEARIRSTKELLPRVRRPGKHGGEYDDRPNTVSA